MNYASVELMALRKELEYYKSGYRDAVALRNVAQIERDEARRDRAELIEALKWVRTFASETGIFEALYERDPQCSPHDQADYDNMVKLLARLAKKGKK